MSSIARRFKLNMTCFIIEYNLVNNQMVGGTMLHNIISSLYIWLHIFGIMMALCVDFFVIL